MRFFTTDDLGEGAGSSDAPLADATVVSDASADLYCSVHPSASM